MFDKTDLFSQHETFAIKLENAITKNPVVFSIESQLEARSAHFRIVVFPDANESENLREPSNRPFLGDSIPTEHRKPSINICDSFYPEIRLALIIRKTSLVWTLLNVGQLKHNKT